MTARAERTLAWIAKALYDATPEPGTSPVPAAPVAEQIAEDESDGELIAPLELPPKDEAEIAKELRECVRRMLLDHDVEPTSALVDSLAESLQAVNEIAVARRLGGVLDRLGTSVHAAAIIVVLLDDRRSYGTLAREFGVNQGSLFRAVDRLRRLLGKTAMAPC